MKTHFQKLRFFQNITCILLMGLILFGCAHAPERTHPQFSTYHRSMKTILVLEPEIDVFEKLPDGSRIFHDMESKTTQRQAHDAIARQLAARRFIVQKADDDFMHSSEVEDITSLFKAVNRSIQLHVFGPQPFPVKVKQFQYDLGPIDELLRASGADGLIVSLGHQIGEGHPIQSWLSIALVEPEGRIIWYGIFGDHEKYDLTNVNGASQIVTHAMTSLPGRGS